MVKMNVSQLKGPLGVDAYLSVLGIRWYKQQSVMHGQCDTKPTVSFPASDHHHPTTSTKLYS